MIPSENSRTNNQRITYPQSCINVVAVFFQEGLLRWKRRRHAVSSQQDTAGVHQDQDAATHGAQGDVAQHGLQRDAAHDGPQQNQGQDGSQQDQGQLCELKADGAAEGLQDVLQDPVVETLCEERDCPLLSIT